MSEKKAKEKRKHHKDDAGDGLADFADMKGSERTPRWEDDLRMYKLPDGKWAKVRVVGKAFMLVRHWLRSKKGKNFPVLCHNFDPVTRRFTKKVCPVCAYRDPKTGEEMRWSKIAYVNLIPRSEQAKNKKHPKEWRFAFAMPNAVIRKIAELTDLEGAEPSDPRKGYDLEILHNPAADPASQYNVQRGEKSKLTEEEQKLDLYYFPKLVKLLPISEIEDIMQRFGYTGEDDDVDEDEVDEVSDGSDDSGKKKKKPAKRKVKDKSDDASDSSDSSDDSGSDDKSSSTEKSDDDKKKPDKKKKSSKKDESDSSDDLGIDLDLSDSDDSGSDDKKKKSSKKDKKK
jgi:hypothetical protein